MEAFYLIKDLHILKVCYVNRPIEDAHRHLLILKLMNNLGICVAICHVLSDIVLTYLIVKV